MSKGQRTRAGKIEVLGAVPQPRVRRGRLPVILPPLQQVASADYNATEQRFAAMYNLEYLDYQPDERDAYDRDDPKHPDWLDDKLPE